MNMKRPKLRYIAIWLLICSLAGFVAARLFNLSFRIVFAITAGALMLNGIVAEIKGRRPGGFLNPRREE